MVLQADAAGDLIVKLREKLSLTITNDLSHQSWGIASVLPQLTFADFTSIQLSRNWGQSLTFTWLGGAGNMTLNGTSWGNNAFWLGTNDVVNGVAGFGNTYDFALGDGPVTINAAVGDNTSNTLAMAAGIVASDLIYQADATGGLIIRIAGTTDMITLANDQASKGGAFPARSGRSLSRTAPAWRSIGIGIIRSPSRGSAPPAT